MAARAFLPYCIAIRKGAAKKCPRECVHIADFQIVATPASPEVIEMSSQAVFRFAPSPNGRLHLGHAYSALLNAALAAKVGGRFLLRIEDIDTARSRLEFERAIVDDLAWLGLTFDEAPRRQREHDADYAGALALLAARGLVYPCFCSRGEIVRASAGARDPDGAPLYPGTCRRLSADARAARLAKEGSAAMRLDTARALRLSSADLSWREYGEGAGETIVPADPSVWGDFVLKRKEMAASYHLAVVVDDSVQGVSDVTRGSDLFPATSAHRLLQSLLEVAAPRYRHHRLVRDRAGEKMSKSAHSMTLAEFRRNGVVAGEIRAALGFDRAPVGSLKVTMS
jgi:glutamyl-Q tRNA(Asp) synthetase